jgi:hypothetical protein
LAASGVSERDAISKGFAAAVAIDSSTAGVWRDIVLAVDEA